MTSEGAGRVFTFSAFEADEAAGELRKQGIRIKLHSQAFRVLLMLLERPSEMVTREQMRQSLWGEDTFVDFDHGLNSAVNKVREALNDSAARPRYVETVTGKGYRFIAPVAQIGVLAGSAAVAGAEPAEGGRADVSAGTVLSTGDELPAPPLKVVRILLLLALGMSAILVYLPFAQRSLVLMYGRGGSGGITPAA